MSDCIFCRIGAGEIPAKEIARSQHAMAFHDINPQAPVHALVIPLAHVSGPAAADTDAGERMLGLLLRFAVQVAARLGLIDGGYRLVLNQGRDGGQSVDHLHVHVLGGRRMTWPPG
ncbi:MAG: HIT domain-containing protein [Gemmatimonadales bacterium]